VTFLHSSRLSLDRQGKRWRSWVPDALGIAWVLAAAFAVLLPALLHGTSLGAFDVLGLSGLSRHQGVVIHNVQANDQILQFIPWTTLAWQQVHQGHLPLWNPYSVLGLPLLFNWQSAAFGLPALVSYLFPVHLAYTVQIVVTLLIAATGAYVFARVLGLGIVGCVMSATLFELSGPVLGWLGWPHTSVISWAGWMFAAALLIIRGSHRTLAITLFAIALAFAIYAGFPEVLLVLEMALIAFVTVSCILRAASLRGSGLILRPVRDLLLATGAGCALAAPLILPGLQYLAGSTRRLGKFPRAFPAHELIHIIFQGFDGSGINGYGNRQGHARRLDHRLRPNVARL